LEKADAKLGFLGDTPGAVPIRVAGPLFEEGSYCDDEVVLEYLGGVLASARTNVSRDDRGTRWVKLVTGLSAYEIRLHYLLYWGARAAYIRSAMHTEWGDESSYEDLMVVFDSSEISAGMDFVTPPEVPSDIYGEALFALHREGLIDDWGMGPKASTDEKLGKDCPGDSVLFFKPTTVGVQLFMWAQGRGTQWGRFDDPEVVLPALEVVTCDGKRVVELEPRKVAPPSGSTPSGEA